MKFLEIKQSTPTLVQSTKQLRIKHLANKN